jgi:hypothetical protein
MNQVMLQTMTVGDLIQRLERYPADARIDIEHRDSLDPDAEVLSMTTDLAIAWEGSPVPRVILTVTIPEA